MIDFLRHIHPEVYGSLILFLILGILAIIIGIMADKANPKNPPWLVMFAEYIVESIEKFTVSKMGQRFKAFAPYLCFVTIYMVMAFLLPLFALPGPLTSTSVPLCFALITFVSLHVVSLKYKGIKGWASRFFEPFIFFLPINIITFPSILISLTFRLFGNAVAGEVIIDLVYWATNSPFAKIGMPNLIGPLITPVLHAFFDIFDCYIQVTVFVLLSALFISRESEIEVKKKKVKRKLNKGEV
ncbi:MAG: F0F1 ATP synthase subunit A [Bacillales bacterium]|jgi:F-type H+-transporting ATPase subunit a|nr:F0F1 ATP synthase subunit A [Bacillales bacterium]